MHPSPLISASDIEKYGYCPLSWWLSREEKEPVTETLREGEVKHAKIASEISGIKVSEEIARESERIVLYFAVGSTIIAVFGLTFFEQIASAGRVMSVIALIWLLSACYFLFKAETLAAHEEQLIAERVMLVFSMVATVIAVLSVSLAFIKDPVLGRVFEVVALFWLIGASFFLYRSLTEVEEARQARTELNLQEGEIEYIDDQSLRPKVFESEKYGLRGRPDFVVLEGDNHIPVEVKTGRVPQGPLFSHILQVAAYCLLLEEEYGSPPPFGILRYGNVQHQIDYEPDLREMLLKKLQEIRKAAESGEVHRNHNRPGKCRNCSRRDICPERLV